MKEIPVPQNEQTFEQWWVVEGPCEGNASFRKIGWAHTVMKNMCEKAWNAALSQPVPQGEQSQPRRGSKPYVVSPERWKESVIALDDLVTELETELGDTKRALELAADYTDVDSFFFIKQAKDERTALPDPPIVADSKRGVE